MRDSYVHTFCALRTAVVRYSFKTVACATGFKTGLTHCRCRRFGGTYCTDFSHEDGDCVSAKCSYLHANPHGFKPQNNYVRNLMCPFLKEFLCIAIRILASRRNLHDSLWGHRPHCVKYWSKGHDEDR